MQVFPSDKFHCPDKLTHQPQQGMLFLPDEGIQYQTIKRIGTCFNLREVLSEYRMNSKY